MNINSRSKPARDIEKSQETLINNQTLSNSFTFKAVNSSLPVTNQLNGADDNFDSFIEKKI